MTNLKKSILMVLAMLIASMAFSQFSRQQAINLVENTILLNDIGLVDVYASLTSRTSSQPIDPAPASLLA